MKKSFAVSVLALLVGASTGFAADNAGLEKKVLELTEQNRMLMKRLEVLEQMFGEK